MDTQNENSMEDFMDAINASMKKIHAGDLVNGTVISVKEDEVLVNIGYMTDGIITREELSYDNKLSASEIVKAGDEIYALVLEINDGEGNVSLSKKAADSLKVWEDLKEAFEKGTSLNITVKEAVKGGVTADVKGVRAFMPASQISVSYVDNLASVVGKSFEAKIIELDTDKKRLVVSAKELELQELETKKEALWTSLKKGEKRTGIVKRLAKFGAFVDLGGVDGLVHNNDLSWKRVNNPGEIVSVGDTVEVFVLDFDKSAGKISLGLKDVAENPWNKAEDKFAVGNVVEGTVVRLADFGAFVELEPGVDGLVHISEISEERILKPSDVLSLGQKVKVKIINIDSAKNKISLSIKEAIEKPKEDYSQYVDTESGFSLADLLKDKLKDIDFDK
ncbi:30S ribosomal protein S1 [Clostridium sp. 19966]|uniref:30S ribosomal protein S1 n=1 Tax=Clostridium sp. 19966 TaxID=2768166 RepID=UPI0028DFFB98|nr:30S ribosomal protein S1 [Clostridium sp. 19966]MDT8718929.1 30S ribosomal protein S1 [Clostridium sp. 19966]